MKLKKLEEIVQEGENIRCEFKLKFSSAEKIAKEICAFANTKGGYLIFGVDDNGEIVGVESEKEETELVIETIKNHCFPEIKYAVDYVEYKGKEVVVFEIFESDIKPIKVVNLPNNEESSEQAYVRVGSKSVPAGKELAKLLKNISDGLPLIKYSIGHNERLVFEYLKKEEKITAKILKNLANISERRASRVLIKMTRANLLFIHNDEKGENYFTLAEDIK
jgi:predicted HTH transcriptional regulator